MASDPLTSPVAGIALIGTSQEEHGRILRANHRLAELLESTPAALVKTGICEHIHPDDQPQAHQAYASLIGNPATVCENTARLVATTGRTVLVRFVASLIATSAGSVVLVRVLAETQ